MNLIKYILDRLTEDRFNCLYCNVEMPPDSHGLCERCKKLIGGNTGHRCAKCSRPVYVEGGVCDFCIENRQKFDRAFAPLLYDEDGEKLIKQMKFGSKRYGYKYMVQYLLEETEVPECDVVTAVPHYGRQRKDFATRLALEYAARRGLPFEWLLSKVKKTPTQHSLGKYDRLQNLKGAFEPIQKDDIRGRKILVVDDILTTGSTMSEIAGTLKKAGAQKVIGLTLAVTPKKADKT